MATDIDKAIAELKRDLAKGLEGIKLDNELIMKLLADAAGPRVEDGRIISRYEPPTAPLAPTLPGGAGVSVGPAGSLVAGFQAADRLLREIAEYPNGSAFTEIMRWHTEKMPLPEMAELMEPVKGTSVLSMLAPNERLLLLRLGKAAAQEIRDATMAMLQAAEKSTSTVASLAKTPDAFAATVWFLPVRCEIAKLTPTTAAETKTTPAGYVTLTQK